jgi:methyl-accepting chemotaxis protein
MFKSLNLERRIKIKTRFNQGVLVLITLIAVIELYKLKTIPVNLMITLVALAIVGILITDFLNNWVINVISNPVYKAVTNANTASNEIVEETVKQENVINKHITLLSDASVVVDKLHTTSNQSRESAQKVADKSQEALNLSSKEQEAVQTNIEKMSTLKQKIEIIAELILELSEHTQQIGSIIGVVEDITEQTNMLALNAAVEAARAGEHGKGFAVVASEIRKLADESKQATAKISSLIHDIQQATNSTVMATEEGTKEIESGVQLAHQIATSIGVLRNTVIETAQSVEGIVNAANNQATNTNEVSEIINLLTKGLAESAISIKNNMETVNSLINISKSLKETIVGSNEHRDMNDYKSYKV